MSTVSRRDFASQMTAALSGAVAASMATPSSAADPMTDKPADSTPRVEDHQLAILKELYPAPHLTAEMFEGIRDGLEHNRALAERIRKVPLAHDVPPAFAFVVPPATSHSKDG
jgi:hypothetical protein